VVVGREVDGGKMEVPYPLFSVEVNGAEELGVSALASIVSTSHQ
jgi:hypothetical protein